MEFVELISVFDLNSQQELDAVILNALMKGRVLCIPCAYRPSMCLFPTLMDLNRFPYIYAISGFQP